MVERFVITAMGKLTVRERLYESVLGELRNLSLDSSDEKRAAYVVSGLMGLGEHIEHPDHGTWADKASHQ